jgi:hypothetical protein
VLARVALKTTLTMRRSWRRVLAISWMAPMLLQAAASGREVELVTGAIVCSILLRLSPRVRGRVRRSWRSCRCRCRHLRQLMKLRVRILCLSARPGENGFSLMDWALDEAYDIVYRLPSPSLLRIDYECYGRYPAMLSLSISRVRGLNQLTKTNLESQWSCQNTMGLCFWRWTWAF